AGAGHAPGQDLAPVGEEPAEPGHLLVVDVLHMVQAEAADLATAAIEIRHGRGSAQKGMSSGSTSPPAAPTATGSASGAAGAPAAPSWRLSRNCTSDALTSVFERFWPVCWSSQERVCRR